MKRVMRLLSVALAAVLALGSFASVPVAAAATAPVTVSKAVNPDAILVGGEAEVILSIQGTPPVDVVRPNDVILVIDRSGSMGSENRMYHAREAAKGFIDLMDFSKHRVGVVDYSTSANGFPLTTDGSAAKAYVDTLNASGNTATGDAIQLAMELLAEHRPEAQPVIVLMTDGEANVGSPNGYEYAKAKATEAKNAGIVFYTIALLSVNDDPDTSAPNLLLKEMATTAHHHHFVLGSVGLPEIYAHIVHEIGIASAYDVVVSDTVAPEFEIVPGSYSHNIPQPVVEGNKITWTFLELKDELLTFTYRIRHREGARTGTIPAFSGSQITYKDYTGRVHWDQVPGAVITVSYPAPVITEIQPDNGSVYGGETVVITGQHFRPGARVQFGRKDATDIVVTPTEITVTAPPGRAETVTVKVINDDGQTAEATYRYWAAPEVEEMTPGEGPLSGGTLISFTGKYFDREMVITFDGVPATSMTYIDGARVQAVSPPGTSPGPVDVVLTKPDGSSLTLPGGFIYLSLEETQPEIHSVTPNAGKLEGGDVVDLRGRNFAADARVWFGTREAQVSAYHGPDHIAVIVPAADVPGPVDVTLENPNGQSAVVPAGYTYFIPAPVVTNVSPASGSVLGGDIVYIDGAHISPGVTVYFGNQAATLLNYYSKERIRVRTPASAQAGLVPVRLVNPDNQEAVWDGLFEYLLPPAPSVTAVTPAEGSVDGGEAVTISGANFQAGTQVFFGEQSATVVGLTSTQITIVTPPSPVEGPVDVKIVDPWGQEVVVADGYTYLLPPPPPAPELSLVSPSSGPQAGGELVYLHGANLEPGLRVFFGSTEAVVVNHYGPDRIRVRTPAAATPGAVDVKVVNPDGQEAVVPAGYSYIAPPPQPDPTITSVSPSEGEADGGTIVYIDGTGFEAGLTVWFGENPAVLLNYYGPERLRVRTPASATYGPVDVRVVNPSGKEAVARDGFTYLEPPPPPAPELFSVSPDAGLTSGNEIVYIDGANLADGLAVYFGSAQATVLNYYGPERIRVRTPAAAQPGTVDVRVVNPGGEEAVLPQAYTYKLPQVEITSVSPSSGPMEGGTLVYIEGVYFAPDSRFFFGGFEAQLLNYYNPNRVRVRAPESPVAGAVDVQVVNADGSEFTLEQGYTYEAPPPTPAPVVTGYYVTGSKGNYLLYIDGEHFLSGVYAELNGTQFYALNFYGPTRFRIRATVQPGTYALKVVNPDGQESNTIFVDLP